MRSLGSKSFCSVFFVNPCPGSPTQPATSSEVARLFAAGAEKGTGDVEKLMKVGGSVWLKHTLDRLDTENQRF